MTDDTAVTLTKDETIRLQAAEIERLRFEHSDLVAKQQYHREALLAEIERLRDDRDSWAQQADDRVKDCEGYINDLLNDAMDWNRLRAGDYRALDPDHQDVFDMVASKDVEIERLTLKAETKQYLVMQRDIDKNELRRYIERLHSALLAIINTRRDPVTIAREALGDE